MGLILINEMVLDIYKARLRHRDELLKQRQEEIQTLKKYILRLEEQELKRQMAESRPGYMRCPDCE